MMTSAAHSVLHVDDDPGDALLMQQACRKGAVTFQLQSVSDGEMAIDYLCGAGEYTDRERFPLPSLMLLDLKMPRKTGFDVLDWTRGQEKFKCLPVIILTASCQEEDIKRAYVLGANSYLVKPVSIHSLTEMIKQVDSYWLRLNQQLTL